MKTIRHPHSPPRQLSQDEITALRADAAECVRVSSAYYARQPKEEPITNEDKNKVEAGA